MTNCYVVNLKYKIHTIENKWTETIFDKYLKLDYVC